MRQATVDDNINQFTRMWKLPNCNVDVAVTTLHQNASAHWPPQYSITFDWQMSALVDRSVITPVA
jgi:hypothetical protein